ncbi:hypothetical protein L6452_04707 [Arctium lappa]|uniref:Uncharacterized protein n=1 Tax=Arctium lappa TaxID=4217 RepID=A0ACB9EEZ3_ARCLA|nr:hypothetical protein L6452_04707 [Arctium lappa]
MAAKKSSSEGVLSRVSSTISESPIVYRGKRAASDAGFVAKKLLKSTEVIASKPNFSGTDPTELNLSRNNMKENTNWYEVFSFHLYNEFVILKRCSLGFILSPLLLYLMHSITAMGFNHCKQV